MRIAMHWPSRGSAGIETIAQNGPTEPSHGHRWNCRQGSVIVFIRDYAASWISAYETASGCTIQVIWCYAFKQTTVSMACVQGEISKVFHQHGHTACYRTRFCKGPRPISKGYLSAGSRANAQFNPLRMKAVNRPSVVARCVFRSCAVCELRRTTAVRQYCSGPDRNLTLSTKTADSHVVHAAGPIRVPPLPVVTDSGQALHWEVQFVVLQDSFLHPRYARDITSSVCCIFYCV